jgi:ribose transport system permease protein
VSPAAILRLPVVRALAALAGIVVLGLVFNAEGAFLKAGTHRDMLRQVSVPAILACGMTLVIISGGIDLAVGSVLAVAAVVFSKLLIHLGVPVWMGVCAVLAAGTACGLASGTLVARFRIQPFIATLAMMVFARGVAKYLSDGQKVSTAVQLPDGGYKYVDVPAAFHALNSRILGDSVAVVTVLFVACLVVSWVVLAKLRWGRHIYAVGGNEEAACLSGVPVAVAKLIAYGLSGLFAGVAGIAQAAQEQQGDPEAGQGYELTAIAMVVIGGTSLNGGRGSIWLTLIGVMTIGYLDKILSINAVPESRRLMLTGAIIVLAVLFQMRRR